MYLHVSKTNIRNKTNGFLDFLWSTTIQCALIADFLLQSSTVNSCRDMIQDIDLAGKQKWESSKSMRTVRTPIEISLIVSAVTHKVERDWTHLVKQFKRNITEKKKTLSFLIDEEISKVDEDRIKTVSKKYTDFINRLVNTANSGKILGKENLPYCEGIQAEFYSGNDQIRVKLRTIYQQNGAYVPLVELYPDTPAANLSTRIQRLTLEFLAQTYFVTDADMKEKLKTAVNSIYSQEARTHYEHRNAIRDFVERLNKAGEKAFELISQRVVMIDAFFDENEFQKEAKEYLKILGFDGRNIVKALPSKMAAEYQLGG